jgi:chromate transporter
VVGGYWDRMREARWRKLLQRALVPITVGFVFSGGYVLATPNGPQWQAALIAAACASAIVATRINPLWFLSAGGLAGYFLF